MAISHRRGELGEAMARLFLEMQGYRWLQGRYRIAGGEIDLIMARGQLIVFVEVKTCGESNPALPEECLNRRQMGRLRRAASHWLGSRSLGGTACRIDLVAVELRQGKGDLQIRHHPGVG